MMTQTNRQDTGTNSHVSMLQRITQLIRVAIIIGVFAIVPLFVLADVDPDHGHEEIPAVQGTGAVFVDIGEDNFIGDGHTEHAHEVVQKVVWYKDPMWWTLFLVSVLLLTLLSLWVHKLIRVEVPRTKSEPDANNG